MSKDSDKKHTNEINQSIRQLKVKKLYHFSAFHNFRYEEDGIGYGKHIVI